MSSSQIAMELKLINTKIPGYITNQINSSNEMHDGSAILIKKNITQNDDNYITDVLETILNTETGEMSIGTTYLPPRRPYLPFQIYIA